MRLPCTDPRGLHRAMVIAALRARRRREQQRLARLRRLL